MSQRDQLYLASVSRKEDNRKKSLHKTVKNQMEDPNFNTVMQEITNGQEPHNYVQHKEVLLFREKNDDN